MVIFTKWFDEGTYQKYLGELRFRETIAIADSTGVLITPEISGQKKKNAKEILKLLLQNPYHQFEIEGYLNYIHMQPILSILYFILIYTMADSIHHS